MVELLKDAAVVFVYFALFLVAAGVCWTTVAGLRYLALRVRSTSETGRSAGPSRPTPD
jgi:hypothetical protein